ncbi:UreD-domain-containing protein [Tilletiopsis washingtonensis]|uniref:UreD-domain-containing protein n=1 Tax=Tilletiopsis washingtonensis TaxID=58919 RepID=A0A316ZGL7_9BASI|nr:UreD-domain-containing protein [Tilletiopsis washingtonensis]PWO00397.1 UreD-domain-containing protein [Tilletiopsis washingtonensis]
MAAASSSYAVPGASSSVAESSAQAKLQAEQLAVLERLPRAPPPLRTETYTGSGLAVLRAHDGSSNVHGGDASGPSANVTARDATFTHLFASFPLKLLHPRASSQAASRRTQLAARAREGDGKPLAAVAVLYVVSYGGGLVSGDTVSLDIDVGHGCVLLLLTQGSTKVFKMRQTRIAKGLGSVPAASPASSTRQTFRMLVRPNASLVLLPDPVTCFAQARYVQTQRFDLRSATTSSLVLLDWFTPGRIHLAKASATGTNASHEERPEVWAFESYRSRNEVRVAGHLLARDVLHLAQEDDGLPNDLTELIGGTPLARRCAPYTCYATLVLVGPECRSAMEACRAAFAEVQQRVVPSSGRPAPLLWSFTPLTLPNAPAGSAAIVRVAATETQGVRDWLRDHLTELKGLVGEDLYRQALG